MKREREAAIEAEKKRIEEEMHKLRMNGGGQHGRNTRTYVPKAKPKAGSAGTPKLKSFWSYKTLTYCPGST